MDNAEPIEIVIKEHLTNLRDAEMLTFDKEREGEIIKELCDDVEFYDSLKHFILQHALRIDDEL